jgi:hypothetical protein
MEGPGFDTQHQKQKEKRKEERSDEGNYHI